MLNFRITKLDLMSEFFLFIYNGEEGHEILLVHKLTEGK
jgi:hypothetical protein